MSAPAPFWRDAGLAAALAVLAMAAVYAPTLAYPYASGELPLFFCEARRILDAEAPLAALAAKYDPTDPAALIGRWWRPTSFHLFYVAVSPWTGWSADAGVPALRLLTGAVLLTIGGLLFVLTRLLAPGLRGAAILAPALAVTHPTVAPVVVELWPHEPLYLIGVLAALCCLARALTAAGPWRRTGWLTVLVLAYASALTAKEQALPLTGVLAGLAGLACWPRRWGGGILPDHWRAAPARRVLAFAAAAGVLLALAFVLTRLPGIQPSDQGPYRVFLNLERLTDNLTVGLPWLFQIHWTTQGLAWVDWSGRVGGTGLWVALAALAGLAGLIGWAVRRGGIGRPPGPAVAVWALVAAGFVALPVYSGGRPWHFVGGALGVSALVAMALTAAWQVAAREPGPARRLVPASILLFVMVQIGLSAAGLRADLETGWPRIRIVGEALRAPPLPASAMPSGATVIYLNHGHDWAFGLGHLFRQAYDDPSLVEVPTRGEAALYAAAAWALATPGPDRLLIYAAEPPHWRDGTEHLPALAAAHRAKAAPGAQPPRPRAVPAPGEKRPCFQHDP